MKMPSIDWRYIVNLLLVFLWTAGLFVLARESFVDGVVYGMCICLLFDSINNLRKAGK